MPPTHPGDSSTAYHPTTLSHTLYKRVPQERNLDAIRPMRSSQPVDAGSQFTGKLADFASMHQPHLPSFAGLQSWSMQVVDVLPHLSRDLRPACQWVTSNHDLTVKNLTSWAR